MITVWFIGLAIGGAFYLFFTGLALWGLFHLRERRLQSAATTKVVTPEQPITHTTTTKVVAPVSIIIAARDEENHIAATLEHLLHQAYAPDRYEIIAVDDRSTDRTAEIMAAYQAKDPRLRLIRQTSVDLNRSPKRQALERAIAEAKGEIIAVTDADCKPDPDWLSNLIEPFAFGADMAVGQARFEIDLRSPWWQRLQALDFQAQMVAAAGLTAVGMPFNCSGASLAYRREAFFSVRGWDGYDHLISGDDELLMAKFVQNKLSIRATIGKDSIVWSAPPQNLRELWRQRVRWGSKGLNYHPSRSIILAGVFLFYLALSGLPLILLMGRPALWGVLALSIKMILDALVLYYGKLLWGDKINPLIFISTELLHPPAIVAFVLAGHLLPLKWKGQRYNVTPKGRAC
ncbi:MAG: glycosyltransferase [Calditrichota bacterium]